MKNYLKQFLIIFLVLALVVSTVSALGDRDDDTVPDNLDNCDTKFNPGQEDGDKDKVGNVCDHNKHKPVVSVSGTTTVTEGSKMTLSITLDKNGDVLSSNLESNPKAYDHPYVISVENKPSGATLSKVDTYNYNFVWTPNDNQAGTYHVTFKANDGQYTGEKTVTLTVIEKQVTPPQENRAPTAVIKYSPTNPEVYQTVTFDASQSSDPDRDALTYAWDLDNDGQYDDAAGVTTTSAFTEPGTYPVNLRVFDGELSDTDTKDVTVTGHLEVIKIECLNPVVVDANQACNAKVEANGHPVKDAVVKFYEDEYGNAVKATCKTEGIEGACLVKYPIKNAGIFHVRATAEKAGYVADNSKSNVFAYNALAHIFDIEDLTVHNSPEAREANQQDLTYYRGEAFWIKFQVVDRNDHNRVITDPNIITRAVLVGINEQAELVEEGVTLDSHYYYKLNKIPTNHNFVGSNPVFVFAFDFAQNGGGQKDVDLMILNNPPKITSTINDIQLTPGQAYTLDLSQYEFDVEDSGDSLRWTLDRYANSPFTADVTGKVLELVPTAQQGSGKIKLTLTDLDHDSDSQVVNVQVGTQPSELEVNLAAFPLSGEAPLTVHFSGAVEGAEGTVTYTWSFGDINVVKKATVFSPIVNSIMKYIPFNLPFLQPNYITHTYRNAGTYTARLTVTDSTGASASDAVEIVVSPRTVNLPAVAVITATSQEGYAPLRVRFSAVQSTGDMPLSFSWDLDGDGDIESTDMEAEYIYEEDGEYTVSLTVTDADEDTNTATLTIIVSEAPTPNQPRKNVQWTKLNLVSGENYQPGDLVETLISFQNIGNRDLKGVKATLSIPELGLFKSNGRYTVDSGETVSMRVVLELPEDAEKGEYDLRATVGNDDMSRVKFRRITIE